MHSAENLVFAQQAMRRRQMAVAQQAKREQRINRTAARARRVVVIGQVTPEQAAQIVSEQKRLQEQERRDRQEESQEQAEIAAVCGRTDLLCPHCGQAPTTADPQTGRLLPCSNCADAVPTTPAVIASDPEYAAFQSVMRCYEEARSVSDRVNVSSVYRWAKTNGPTSGAVSKPRGANPSLADFVLDIEHTAKRLLKPQDYAYFRAVYIDGTRGSERMQDWRIGRRLGRAFTGLGLHPLRRYFNVPTTKRRM
jgi:hypothetical protein